MIRPLKSKNCRSQELMTLAVDAIETAQNSFENNTKGVLVVSIVLGCICMKGVSFVTVPNAPIQRIIATLAVPVSVNLTLIMLWLVRAELGTIDSALSNRIGAILKSHWKNIKRLVDVGEVFVVVSVAGLGALSAIVIAVFAIISCCLYFIYFLLTAFSTFNTICDATAHTR